MRSLMAEILVAVRGLTNGLLTICPFGRLSPVGLRRQILLPEEFSNLLVGSKPYLTNKKAP